MNKIYTLILLVCSMSNVNAASIFADSLIDSAGAVAFGSGSVLGAPDGGGLTLNIAPIAGNFIEIGFGSAIGDGAGFDIRIYDNEDIASDINESANVFASTDGSSYTFIGSVIGGSSEGFLDLSGVYSDAVNFLRIEQVSTADALDIIAIEGLNEFSPVPVPAAIWLFASGLLGLIGVSRRARNS